MKLKSLLLITLIYSNYIHSMQDNSSAELKKLHRSTSEYKNSTGKLTQDEIREQEIKKERLSPCASPTFQRLTEQSKLYPNLEGPYIKNPQHKKPLLRSQSNL